MFHLLLKFCQDTVFRFLIYLSGFFSSFFFLLQVPVPMVAPPLVKDMQDAAVQAEPLPVSEEKATQVPASAAG